VRAFGQVNERIRIWNEIDVISIFLGILGYAKVCREICRDKVRWEGRLLSLIKKGGYSNSLGKIIWGISTSCIGKIGLIIGLVSLVRLEWVGDLCWNFFARNSGKATHKWRFWEIFLTSLWVPREKVFHKWGLIGFGE